MTTTLSSRFRWLATATMMLVLAACGSTKVTDSWQAPGFKRQTMQKVLVVGVTTNITNRILFEHGFVDELNKKGIDAIASYSVIGTSPATRASVTAYLKRNRIPYVIVTHYGGTQTTAEYVPPAVYTYSTGPLYPGPYYSTFGDYWDRYGSTVTYERGAYVSTRSNVVLTTSIYDVPSEKLVWTGRSETFRPDAISVDAAGLAKKIVNHIN